ncbi:PX-associated-domain-containing protein [Hypomontagnella monticulosa]|nr:PX-associated-domain-containing protein [Hypomontagnella monticulosa]
MSSTALSPQQLGALLDILVHHETYSEAESFKYPDSIEKYGYPFNNSAQAQDGSEGERSQSPLLQLLLTRLILPIPGTRDLPSEFWTDKFRNLMKRFGEAELSESYDKGTLGSRKRLASAASVIHECITRGLLNGIPNDGLPDLHNKYDMKVADDLSKAWDDVVQHLVHGNLIDDLFDQFMKTSNIEDHSPAVKAAVDLAILYIATFLHHLFVLSAEGPYLLKLLSNVHTLVPYAMIGQTLRVGNAGTMINAMVKLFLAKVSVGAISNWLGLTQNAADGMNLMQRIISLVMEWDTSDFRKAADSIKRSKEGPNEALLTAIDEHLQAAREVHESIRELSQKDSKSIVVAILEARDEALVESLTETQHTQCLEYYSAQLAIRDREKITEVLCRQTPDLITSMVRDIVSVFEPMIRTIHKNVDIRKHLTSVESFLTDLIETSKPKKREDEQKKVVSVPPSVEDYVALLRRNRQLAYDYLHEFAEGCPDLRTTWLNWAKKSLESFRQPRGSENKISTENKSGGSSHPDKQLQNLFRDLPDDIQTSVKTAIDSHAKYLSILEGVSMARMQSIISGIDDYEKNKTGGNMGGPGVYITRWHCLLDSTVITPSAPRGPSRRGKDVKTQKALGKTEAIASSETWDPDALARQEEQEWPEPPDTAIVVEALGSQFRDLVAEISATGLPSK